MDFGDTLIAIDEFDDMLHHGPAMPLSDRVRLKPEALAVAVARIREGCETVLAGKPGGCTLVAVARLEEVARDAKPVPLLRSVSVDKEAIYDCLDRIRASLPDDLAPDGEKWTPPAYNTAIDDLDVLVMAARDAPLSLRQRLDPAEFSAALDRARSAMVAENLSAAIAVLDRLAVMVDEAKPVPFSSDVKVDQLKMLDTLDELREILVERVLRDSPAE